MESSTQSNLCKGIRACGIPKKPALEIVNLICKWSDSNGPEWTVDRIKSLRQWYESYLAGDPKPPEWFKHGKDNMPTGVWSYVFRLPTAKALGVLSASTVFYNTTLSDRQREKFLHGVRGNGNQDLKRLRTFVGPCPAFKYKKPELRSPVFPTVFDMTGSIPVHDGQSTVRPKGNLGKALKAIELSWESVPQVTFNFLDRMDWLSYMPIGVLGNPYQLELNRPHSSVVGKISIIQEPELKGRVVANPNRVTQVTLQPLGELLFELARRTVTDCTFDQEAGCAWVQDQLKQGHELAGSDLTSASDLLDLDCCLFLVDHYYGLSAIPGYKDYERYFSEVARGDWYFPHEGGNTVRWNQGFPMGTMPCFGYLTLGNNCLAMTAWYMAKAAHKLDATTRVSDSFRVLGDDIVMRSEMAPFYDALVRCCGGEINHSKTLTSNQVAEFAGRVITPQAVFLKRVRFAEPSDNSFMSYVSQLGDQAKYFLKPKQREIWDVLRDVPGIILPGSQWSTDGFGYSLADRYQWYLEEVEPALRRVEPDRTLVDYDLILLKAELSLREVGQSSEELLTEPFERDGYLPSSVTNGFKPHGDPRLANGKTMVEAYHQIVGAIRPFRDWLEAQHPVTSLTAVQDSTQVPDEDKRITLAEAKQLVKAEREHSRGVASKQGRTAQTTTSRKEER